MPCTLVGDLGNGSRNERKEKRQLQGRERRENEGSGVREIAFCLLFQSKVTLWKMANCNHTHTHSKHMHTLLVSLVCSPE